MIKKVAISLIVLCCVAWSFGSNVENESSLQKRPPDLSGTWKLDKSKGNYVKYSGLKPDADFILIVSHAEPEIKVTRKSIWGGQEQTQEMTYYSDGRGEIGRRFIGNSEGKSKSEWDGDKFVTRFSITSEHAGQRRVSFDVIQEWKMSADGKTLTQTERVNQPISTGSINPGSGPMHGNLIVVFPSELKRVFHRAS
jgi:hypothetical protein